MVMVAGEPFTAGKAEVWVSTALYYRPQNFVLMALPRLHLNLFPTHLHRTKALKVLLYFIVSLFLITDIFKHIKKE